MTGFRPDIEGLRAVAILAVVGYHVGVPGFGGGFVGVDVFFALSGYLITSLLWKELAETSTISFSRFYARRARRLLPAMTVMLLATVIAGTVLYAPVEHDGLANTALTTALYSSNLYFARASTDYLATPSHTNPLLHTWSLSVEEQFYLVWPLLMLWAAGATRHGKVSVRRVMYWGLGASLVSFAACEYLTSYLQPWAFFLSPMRCWEFAIGGLAALPWDTPRFRPMKLLDHPRVGSAVGWLGLCGIVLAVVAFDTNTRFPGTAALLPVVATVMVLCSYSPGRRFGVAAVLSARPFQELGRLSYSWYLWHWPFLVFATAVKRLSVGERGLTVLLSLAVAEASYRWVESPIRHNRELGRRPGWSLALAGALAVSAVVLCVAWKGVSSSWADTAAQARYSRMKNDFPLIYSMPCDDYFHSATVLQCAFGRERAPRTIVLFGDSHAGHWFPALHRIVSDHPDVRLVVITKSQCPIVDSPFVIEALHREYTECSDWRQAAIRRIAELRPTVVLVSYAEQYPFTVDAWHTGVRTALASLSAASETVLVVRDVPTLGFDAPTCLARREWWPAFVPRHSECKRPLGDDRDPVYALQKAAARELPNVGTIDMTDAVCPTGECSVVQHGIVTYRDETHLTTAFAAYLAPELWRRISEGLGDDPHKTGVLPVAMR